MADTRGMRIEPRHPADTDRCPCGSGDTFGSCCGPLLRGERRASTAEALMRSRYTAYATQDADHLLRSWLPRTSPSYDELTASLAEEMRWLRLEIRATEGGGPFDAEGVVEFTAICRTPEGRRELRERSTFTKVDGAWQYVAGELTDVPGRREGRPGTGPR